MNWMYNLIVKLQCPYMVASFQQFFGIKPYFNNSQIKTNYFTQLNPLTSTSTKCNDLVGDGKKCTINNKCQSTLLDCNDYNKHQKCKFVYFDVKYKFWHYLFLFGASLGYEVFYASFFPLWFWNIDGAVGRRIVLLWALSMYIGQSLKDLIRWPRPLSPPVVILEPEYAMEYGMPSTHALVGAVIPFSMVIFTINRYDYPAWIGFVLAILWCSLVCGSRLYLGMHSVLDIIAGLVLAALMLMVFLPIIDSLDHYILTNKYSPLISLPSVIGLAKFYPKLDFWSPARGDTCVIIGAAAGILFGSWINFQLGIISGPNLPTPFPIIWPGFSVIGLAILRATIGILCIVSVRALGKFLTFTLVCYFHQLNPKDPKTKINYVVEVPVKLLTYFLMGASITYLSPAVFRFLKIERPTMFTEV